MITQGQVTEYKIAYNKLINRYKKGAKYLEDNSIPQSEREKHLPELEKIVGDINKALDTFEKCGIELSADERMNGFSRL
jgi:uncharacterized FlaG/YvyC family protein